jgi:hypothetical protein
MTKRTLTLTRDQALAIIQQAIGPGLMPVLDFLLSCKASNAHNDTVQRVPVVGELWRRKITGEVVTVNRVTHVDIQCGYRDGLNVYHDMDAFKACFEPVYGVTDSETDAEIDAAEKVGVKVGQVWVGNESGIAVNVVELNGSDVGYKYLGGTGITCTTPVDEFTVLCFLPNV